MSEKAKRDGRNKKAADLALAFAQKLKPEGTNSLAEMNLAWEKAVGPKLAPLATLQDFQKGELVVLVKSSTLYTLFVQYEKSRLLELLKRDFPQVKNIVFKMG